MAASYVEVPEGWQRLGGRGFGPFVTREVYRLPDGSRLQWDSRWHRKHAGRLPGGSTWWAPGALAWWMGVLFAVGSVCFALGSFPPYVTAVGATPDNITFFVGSIFFTTASFLQYLEVASAPSTLVASHRDGFGSLLRIRHRRIDWWAAAIQLLGTLWFNRTTLSALLVGLGASPDHHPVWRPDALGSICFLVASWLAWAEECHGAFAWRPSRISWQITALNLAGSIAFGVSAIASYVTSSGRLLSVALTNLGTFAGAVCFLVGAVLLLPERTLERPADEPDPGGGPTPARPVGSAP
jgi:YrhK-like protein